MFPIELPELANVDRELDRALRAWDHLPDVEAAFGDWPEDVALEFVFAWTVEEDRLHRLAEHAERGDLTDRQQTRYRQLVELTRQNRPIVERLIAS